MDKDQVIEDFFRSLRVSLTNAFSYPKDHPYFIKSVEILKLKLQDLLHIFNPLRIGVTNLGLVVDGKNLTKVGFYDELARLLHERKIESIEISGDIIQQELIQFLGVISLPQKEFFKDGGLSALLEKEAMRHFKIQELDYSVFLYEGGQECTDVWGFMLKDALRENNIDKINQFADNFGTWIKRTNQNDIFAKQEIPEAINAFMVYLKNKDQEKFAQCSKDIFLWLMHNQASINDENLAKLAKFFDSLTQEDFGNLFWEGLAQEENFDSLSLQFFSKITEQRNPQQIAQGILNKTNLAQHLNSSPRLVKRIKDLLTNAQADNLSAVYRNTLKALLKGISFSGVLFFDQMTLKRNYRYLILNMLAMDNDQDGLLLAAEILGKELPSIFEENDLGFLKDLKRQLLKMKQEGITTGLDLEKQFSVFMENIILNQTI